MKNENFENKNGYGCVAPLGRGIGCATYQIPCVH